VAAQSALSWPFSRQPAAGQAEGPTACNRTRIATWPLGLHRNERTAGRCVRLMGDRRPATPRQGAETGASRPTVRDPRSLRARANLSGPRRPRVSRPGARASGAGRARSTRARPRGGTSRRP
jgi:hypothetical protein